MMVSNDWDECICVSVCACACAFERGCRGGRQAAEQHGLNNVHLKAPWMNLFGERDLGHKWSIPKLFSKLELGFMWLKLCLTFMWTKERCLLCCIDVLCFELQLHVENVWKAVFVKLMSGKSWVKFKAWMPGLEQVGCSSQLNQSPYPNYSTVLRAWNKGNAGGWRAPVSMLCSVC